MAVEGDALKSLTLLRELTGIAQSTAGLHILSRGRETIFEDISEELRHTYMLAFRRLQLKAKVAYNSVDWHRAKECKIRARQGYYSQ